MDSTPGEDVVKIVKMTTKNLEYHRNLMIKQLQGWRGPNPNLKLVLWIKCYQTALHATERKSQSMWPTSLLSYLKKCPRPPQPQQPPPWSVSSDKYWGRTLYQQKDCDSLKAQVIEFFSNKVYLIKVCTFLRQNAIIAHLIDYNIGFDLLSDSCLSLFLWLCLVNFKSCPMPFQYIYFCLLKLQTISIVFNQ